MLALKDVLVAVILQFLIGVVDAKLLKAICLEILESKHVQYADGQALKPQQQTGQFITSREKTVNIIMLVISYSFSSTYSVLLMRSRILICD